VIGHSIRRTISHRVDSCGRGIKNFVQDSLKATSQSESARLTGEPTVAVAALDARRLSVGPRLLDAPNWPAGGIQQPNLDLEICDLLRFRAEFR
jgi:hypothetical protein